MDEQNIREIFARNLTRLIAEKGTTQTDLAKSLSIAKSTVSEWCAGNNVPRTKMLNRLCVFFNAEVSDFLSDKAETAPAQTPTQAELHALVDKLTPEQQQALLIVAQQFDTTHKL